jgi:hypothetical protein
MSRNINVNPAHYKVAGRERQGENIIQNVERQAFAQQKADADRWREKQAPPPWETTPPAPPVTQEQRDEATAIAEVQGKKPRATRPRATAKRAAAKRAVAKKAPAKRTGSTRAAAKRTASTSRASRRAKPAAGTRGSKRRAKAPARRRTR